jgi:hypothetical protein
MRMGVARHVALSTFALIHGGGGSAWDSHLVAPELRKRGHEPIAVDLPTEYESAGWWDYADTLVEAIGDRRRAIVSGTRSAASRRRSSVHDAPSTSSCSSRG